MILVTGAAGYIGSQLVRFLSNQHLAIRAIDNFSVHRLSQVDGVPIHSMDLTQPHDVKQMVSGVDTIIHLGAISDVAQCEKNNKEAVQINLLSLQYLIQESIQAGVRKIIFPSSFAVYDPEAEVITEQTKLNPSNFYGHLKKWGEELLLAEQAKGTLDIVIFRQSNVYGRGQVSKQTVIESFCHALLHNREITIYGSGQQTRNFIHLDDVTWAYYQALSTPVRGIYNLGGEETYSILDLACLVNRTGKRCLGRSVPILRKERTIPEKKTHFTALDTQKIKTLFQNRQLKSVQAGIEAYFSSPV
ncbi:MAG: NAD(P)-dependent oxidoreductase [Firmicutes bacterium]|uniref:UDP-glucose 4-epimerase n=1 Tax=Melghirimyces thermohalophilus TaxID=1236220 RepID=A0A1G6KU46_9BACL|nr:NAD(P)-dependent oxidoreductase [Melghirimyces thermohalophilus]MDA8353232.1 NAD(P)-dependent oxidoreductase [Bacillota bacterium]SDC34301.1 UDP-glucose 4-epimerase [Melghirimyces thermohalophilus]